MFGFKLVRESREPRESREIVGASDESIREQQIIAQRATTLVGKAALRQLKEAVDILDNYVDPSEALLGPNGERWDEIGKLTERSGPSAMPYSTWEELQKIRVYCRCLAHSNEFAINGHENRISYIVGTGHVYKVEDITDSGGANEDLIAAVQEVVDDFVKVNRWHCRQQEIRRRIDRDGECFLRMFNVDGELIVRFIEPAQIKTPEKLRSNPNIEFGIEHAPNDAETIIAYYVDDEPVPADEIQHRKENVDGNVPRGVPLFWPVRKELSRADKTLRNMAALAEVQSAIAMIRRHTGATAANVQAMVSALASASVTNQTTGKTTTIQQYQPGTIVDAPQGTEYDFPNPSDPSKFVNVLQAILRAVASRLVMPEFMLSSDASNANYASTMVAEGPAVKMFQRLQASTVEYDEAILRRAIEMKIAAGNAVGMEAEYGGEMKAVRLPADVLDQVEVKATPPTVVTRDELKEAQRDSLLSTAGVLSPQTFASRQGLDYDQEQENIETHVERTGGSMVRAQMPGDIPQDPEAKNDRPGQARDGKGGASGSAS